MLKLPFSKIGLSTDNRTPTYQAKDGSLHLKQTTNVNDVLQVRAGDTWVAPLARPHVAVVEIENLGAGVDIAARAVFAAPTRGCTITKVGIIPQGASAGIDDSNTAVIALADGAGNSILSQTYDTDPQPPAANVYGALNSGIVSSHGVLTANEVVTVAVTQGATADLPAFLLLIEYTQT